MRDCNCKNLTERLGATPAFLVVTSGKRAAVCLDAKPTKAQKEQFLRTANGTSCRVVALQTGTDPRPERLVSLNEIREAFNSGDQSLLLLELEDKKFRVVAAWAKPGVHIDASVEALSQASFLERLTAPLQKVSQAVVELPAVNQELARV